MPARTPDGRPPRGEPPRRPAFGSGTGRRTRRSAPAPERRFEELAPDYEEASDGVRGDGYDETEAVARRRQASEDERRAMFAALLAQDPFVDEEPEPAVGPEPHVTVALVTHDGARWLTTTLRALAAQTRPVDHAVAADTGSTDSSPQLLIRALGTTAVLQLPRSTGYGAALRAALAAHPPPAGDSRHELEFPPGFAPRDDLDGQPDGPDRDAAARAGAAPRREWLWLLHDDSAPAPDALERLLDHARRNPSAGILGVKAVDWAHPDRLVEVGLTTDRAGRRVTDLEYYELDQGQHDQPRDVLAVGTAGSLVRRDVWDALGGLDADLPMLRDDVDLGWRATLAGHRVVVVPAARVRHARATSTGHRAPDALPGRLRRRDREHGMHVVLANAGPLRGGLVGLPLALAGALLRALALLLTRRPREAADELLAAGALALHPLRLVRARRRRAIERTLPARAARPLLVRAWSRLRASLLATTDAISGSGGELAGTGLPEDADDLPGDDTTLIRRLFLRPVVGLVLVLVVVGLVTERALLRHGTLTGGRLLPAANSAADLWRSYAASWHTGAYGSTTPASPWQPVLALVSLPFGGNPGAAVAGLFLLAIPLAGLSAWLATRRAGLSTRLRLWAAATYALLPPLGGAIGGGRFDAVVAIIAVPLVFSAAQRLLTEDPLTIGWNYPFAAGLGLAVAASFSPPLWLFTGLIGGGGAVLVLIATHSRVSATRRAIAMLIMLGVPVALNLPYLPAMLTHPRQLLIGLGAAGGLAGQPGPGLSADDLLLLRPGGPLQPVVWLTVPLLLAAAVGLIRQTWWRVAAVASAVAIAAYALALVVARTGAVAGGQRPFGWPGVALAVAAAALLLAALVGGRRARETYAGMAFGLRQPLGLLVAVLAVALPLATGLVAMVSGTDGPLVRGSASDLPAFVSDDAAQDRGQRVLRLDVRGDGRVGFTLTRVDGAKLGDEDLYPAPAGRHLVERSVADLTSNRGTDAAEVLSTFHVAFVALPTADADELGGLADVLNAQPALSRFAVPGNTLLWQVLLPSSRIQLLTGALARSALHPAPAAQQLGHGPLLAQVRADPPAALRTGVGVEGARVTVAASTGQRVLVLADSRNGGWRATLGGRALAPATAWGWAQAFVVPADLSGGRAELRVWHQANSRNLALTLQVVSLGVVVVLGAPSVRRRNEPTDLDGGESDDHDADVPQVPLVGASRAAGTDAGTRAESAGGA